MAKRATRCAKFLVRSRLNLKSCTVSVRHFVSDHSRTQFVSWLCDTFCVRPGSDLECFTLLKPKLTSPTDGVGCTLVFAKLPFSFSWFADTKPIRLEIYLKISVWSRTDSKWFTGLVMLQLLSDKGLIVTKVALQKNCPTFFGYEFWHITGLSQKTCPKFFGLENCHKCGVTQNLSEIFWIWIVTHNLDVTKNLSKIFRTWIVSQKALGWVGKWKMAKHRHMIYQNAQNFALVDLVN